jgi:quercetin dioxygenase-like cupin family protein
MEGEAMTSLLRMVPFALVLGSIALLAMPGLGQNTEQVRVAFEHAIPNTDRKIMVAVVVTYPPGGKSPPHHHAASAFIYAQVLSGAIRSQVGEDAIKTYHVGESFYEEPGSYHRVSENASDKSPATMLAVFVVDSKDKQLTIPDQKKRSR